VKRFRLELRTFILLHLAAAAIGTAAFWFFVLPTRPAEALADDITAAAVAGYAEIMAMRLGG
jgi:hypothetical protein